MNLTLYETQPFNCLRLPTVMRKRPTIGLLIESSSAYGRGLLRGVQAYFRQQTDWQVFVPELIQGDSQLRSLHRWHVDGAIVRIENQAVAKAIENWDVPLIDVGTRHLIPHIPSVHSDDSVTATMAFDHLYEQGFRNVAYFGTAGAVWSEKRRDSFVARAHRANLKCHVYESSGRKTWRNELKAILAWIMSVPRPLAIMASHDRQGAAILDCCRQAGIHVPQEVAVIGVDNDELLCDLTDPPMSSVTPDIERIGYTAAKYLDTLLDGEDKVPRETLIRPVGVVARRSTDSYAIDDPDVVAAARFIRNHALKGIKVTDVLAAVPMGRRVLESRFRTYLGRTPHQEILRVQLSHVRTLLRETTLPLEKIAAQCGFRHVEYMSVVFKRELGQTPSAYRQQCT